MIYENPLALIGNTPLLKLSGLVKIGCANVYLKLETSNLTGSVKDRPALQMIESAEAAGRIIAGKTVLIESTSGNLGLSLAAISAYKGYRFICVLDPKAEKDKINAMLAFGAEIVMITAADRDGGYQKPRIAKVKELLQRIPNAYNLDQYNNPDNPTAHTLTTGPEIYRDLNGKLDMLIGAVSTGGTLCGTARFLKEKVPHLTVIGVEPFGSAVSGARFRPYLQQGTGLSFTPTNYDPKLIDKTIHVTDKGAFLGARLLARRLGLLVGGSAGGIVNVALQLAKKYPNTYTIVAVVPDNGDRYLNTVYSDEWLSKNGIKINSIYETVTSG